MIIFTLYTFTQVFFNDKFFPTFSDICTPNPCKNNGECKSEGNDTFICNGCDPGWTGQNCTEDINGGFQLLDLIIPELESHMTG